MIDNYTCINHKPPCEDITEWVDDIGDTTDVKTLVLCAFARELVVHV